LCWFFKRKEVFKLGKNVWVSPDHHGWKVHKEGEQSGTVYSTKEQAVNAGVTLGRMEQSELSIQHKNGTIEEKRSYGNDPCPPKDQK
jgi:hypothetical protein